LQIQAVAQALEIHPFMLSRWRKEVRNGELKSRTKFKLGSKRVREIDKMTPPNSAPHRVGREAAQRLI